MRDPSPAVAGSGSAKPRPDAKLETLMRQILGEPGELAQAAELAFGRGRPKLLDHLAHLHVLLQHLVDLLDRGAAATSDALAALAVDEGMIFTLGSGHRVDDGLDALESALVHLRILGEVSERPKFRQHADDLLERAHLAQLAQLVAKVFEGELVPPQLALELRGFLGIDGLLGRSEERR